MNDWIQHLPIVPVVLPLATAVLMLLLNERRRTLKAAINIVSTAVLLGVAIALLLSADAPTANGTGNSVYLLGNWPAPFGIVLVVDRLSALMLVLTGIIALSSLLFSIARWHRAGSYFHPLFQFMLMGLNGAFLTGDLFNLFVFFELLLAASYGLVLHGSGSMRIKAGLHYITINLAASSLFLIGASLIYGTAGTLNMADLAARLPAVTGDDRMLLDAGMAILGVAFLVKAGMWPLGFWLPGTYAVSAAPVAASFSIMTKVGIYAVLRLWLLMFAGEVDATTYFGDNWLLIGGIATVVFGSLGALAAQDLARLAGFTVIVSSGTLLAVISVGNATITGAALYYLMISILTISAFYLLIELIERGRVAGADVLAVTIEAFGDEEEEEGQEVVGVAIPATVAILGVSFACCALLLAGLPPLAGFIAKFLMMSALFNPATIGAGSVDMTSWLLLALLILSSLAVLIAMARAGIRVFWVPVESEISRVRVIEMAPIAVLLLLCMTLTVQAGPVMRFMQETAQNLHTPQTYVNDVLRTAPVKRAPSGGGS